MAALSLINYTAGICADKGAKLLGGTISPAYIPLMDDAMRQAYTAHGKPELHDISDVRWFPGQMAYIAGTDTIFRYEKPAVQIMIGSWWAEALSFCEIGSRAGAIQIGGTDYRPYMPYFIAMCDYALIGEEIVAQADGPLGLGLYPSGWWRATQIVEEMRRLELPPEARPGDVTIRVGLYEPVTGARLRRTDAPGDTLDMALEESSSQ